LSNAGKVAVFENKNIIMIDKMEYSKEKYTSVSKGKVTIKNIDGLIECINIVDYNPTKHTFLTKGMTVGRNIKTGNLEYISTDELKNNMNFEHFNKGFITVVDMRTKENVKVSITDYKKYDYYKNMNSKLIKIFNNNNEEIYSCFGGFKDFCSDKSLPYEAFRKSYYNNGKKLYLTHGKREKQLEKLGFLKYKGWYAIKE